MKKIYIFLFIPLFTFSLSAQTEVTFQVDMSNETVSDEGVFISGDWMGAAGLGGDWQEPGTNEDAELKDDDGDGIYTLTVTLSSGPYQYKYSNGASWPNAEAGGASDNYQADLSECGADNGFGGFNRLMEVPDEDIYNLTAFEFNSCTESSLTSIEDLAEISEVQASPNPFINRTTITFANPNNEMHAMIISDITGKIVISYENVSGSQVEVNRGALNSGIYFASLRNNNGNTITKKLMVK